MAWPNGMELVTVTVGSSLSFFGDEQAIKVTVTPVIGGTGGRLIWAATGQPVVIGSKTFQGVAGTVASFTVPNPDQSGFIDGAGNAVTNWAYSAVVEVGSQRWTQAFQPVAGQSSIDLDMVQDGQVSAPVSAPVPAVTSVNGKTGPVTIETGGVSSFEDLQDVPEVFPPDAALVESIISAEISNPESSTHTALNTAIDNRAPSASTAVQPFLSAIENGVRDLDLLVIGDSTGNETSEWVYLFFTGLAARYPSHAFHYRLWNDTAQAYDAATVIGSGIRKVTLWNAAMAGATTQSWQGVRYASAIRDTPADLVMISLGHNEQPDSKSWRGRYLSLTETISAQKPAAAIVLVGQNPATGNSLQAQRIDIYKDIAARRGYGFIDAHAAFVEAGGNLTADGIHPAVTGSRLWADVALSMFRRSRAEPRPQPQTPIIQKSPDNWAANGMLADWTGNTPSGWSFNLCAPTKDTTGMETEAAAVTVTCDSAGGNVYVPLDVTKVKGKTVTVAVRVKIAAGAGNTTGRLALIDSASSNIQINEAYPTSGYRWMIHHGTISANATTARVQIYAGTVGSQMTIDRVIVTEGLLPMDAAPVSTGGAGAVIQSKGWNQPTGLATTSTVTADRLYVKRIGSQVYCLISNMALPASSPQMKVATIPVGYRSTAGLPGQVASSIAQTLATGDTDPKNVEFMAASGGDLWWNGARNAVTGAQLASPARIDGVLTWTTEEAFPA